jgi:hypothetical protein
MSDRPLREGEIEALGYQTQPNGSWKLVRPDARPAPRKGLCRGCQKFEAMSDGICEGCAYFGFGDPHGINAKDKPVESGAARALTEQLLRELEGRDG